MFNKDKTHGHMFFLFGDEGLVSVNPVPPKTDGTQVHNSIVDAIQKHDLYGVILIGEVWTYFPKEKDHTAFQLLDGEMKVSDLNEEDKSEALYVRMESRDNDCVVYLDKILRDGDMVKLGEGKRIGGEDLRWFS